MKKLLYILLGIGIAFAGTVSAVQISVPSAPSAGYHLVSNSVGNYLASSTNPIFAGFFFATSTTQASIFQGGFISAASSTFSGNATTTGTFFAGIASSTSFFGAGINTCNAGNVLTYSGGKFGCAADAQGTGAYSFTPSSFGTQAVSATTSPLYPAALVTGTTTIGSLVATSTLNLPYLAGGFLSVNTDGGKVYSSASSSLFGYTPLNPTRNLTIAGTANQLTSSAGAQDLSADRTWTLSLPQALQFPLSFTSTYGTTTYASSTALTATNLFSTVATTTYLAVTNTASTSNLVVSLLGGTGTTCVQASASGLLSSTGSACGAGGGSAFPFTPTTWGGVNANSTSTLMQFLAGTVSATSSIGNLTTGSITATSSLTLPFVTGTQCLHATGGVVSGTGSDCGTGGGTFSFTPQSDGNATSTEIIFKAGFLSNFASSTINGNATTTGTFFAAIASSTQLFGANLASCAGGTNALTWSAGTFGCNSISASGSVGNWFDGTTNFGAGANSTSTPIWFKNGLMSSTTAFLSLVQLTDPGAATSTLITLARRQLLNASSSDSVGNFFFGLDAGSKITNGAYNTGFGYQVLHSVADGVHNTAVGMQALFSTVSGADNTAFGYATLFSNTTGSDNTAVGMQALVNNTSGANNTATGYSALLSNTTGSDNTAVGQTALTSNITGMSNTAIGEAALNDNTAGERNGALGFQALKGTTGFNNTGVGYLAGLANTSGVGNTYIGALADASVNNLSTSTAIGAGALVKISNSLILGGFRQNAVFAGIGTTSPFARLSIHANPNDSISNGILFAIGSSTALATTTLFSVNNIGLASSTNLTVSGLGGTGTTCVQASASGSLSSTGSACGSGGGGTDPFSLHIPFGYSGTTTPIFIGTSTPNPQAVLTVGSSTAPQLSLVDNGNDSAWNFRAIGSSLFISTSSNTTFATSTIPAIAINGNGSAIFSISSTTPFSRVAIQLLATDNAMESAFMIGSTTATATTTLFNIQNSGKIYMPGLGTDAAAHTYTMCGEATTFQAVWDTTTCVLSNRAAKTNISGLDIGLTELLKVHPVVFNWKLTGDPKYDNDINVKHQQIGVIADEIEKIDKRLVTYDNQGDIKGFRYDFFTAWITKGIQDFYGQFQALTARVSGLEHRLNAQQQEIDELKIRLDKLEK